MTTNRQPYCLFHLILVALVCDAIGLLASDFEENRRIKNECAIQTKQVDKQRIGPIDCRVFLQVTSVVRQASVTVECRHRPLGVRDWLIRVRAPSSNGVNNVDARLIAGALLLAVDTLHRDYTNELVGEIYLEPPDMPADFSGNFYQAVATQMKELDSKAQRFNDPKVREMVKKAYRQMDDVRYIKSRFEEAGFTVKVDTAELCCLKRSLEGKTWKTIADQPAAGLEPDVATCCMVLEVGRKPDAR